MKRENLKLFAVILGGLLIYLLFFIETVEDVPLEKPAVKTEKIDAKRDSVHYKDTIQ
jgi:hypothetical protein